MKQKINIKFLVKKFKWIFKIGWLYCGSYETFLTDFPAIRHVWYNRKTDCYRTKTVRIEESLQSDTFDIAKNRILKNKNNTNKEYDN